MKRLRTIVAAAAIASLLVTLVPSAAALPIRFEDDLISFGADEHVETRRCTGTTPATGGQCTPDLGDADVAAGVFVAHPATGVLHAGAGFAIDGDVARQPVGGSRSIIVGPTPLPGPGPGPCGFSCIEDVVCSTVNVCDSSIPIDIGVLDTACDLVGCDVDPGAEPVGGPIGDLVREAPLP